MDIYTVPFFEDIPVIGSVLRPCLIMLISKARASSTEKGPSRLVSTRLDTYVAMEFLQKHRSHFE